MQFAMARSKAGHDKGKLYVVSQQTQDAVFLADGKYKLLAAPKKKKWKHVQIIRAIPPDVLAETEGEKVLSDVLVKRILKLYQKAVPNAGKTAGEIGGAEES